MFNLNLLTEKRQQIRLDNLLDRSRTYSIIHFVRNPLIDDPTEDEDSTSIYYYALISSNVVIAINIYGSIIWSSDLSVYNEFNETRTNFIAESNWFTLAFIHSNDHLVALSHSGSIVTIDSLTGKVAIVGTFDFGIISGSWSSDSELLCVVIRQSLNLNDDGTISDSNLLKPVIVIMNSHFEVLVETYLPVNILSEPIFISWKPADNSLVAISSLDEEDGTRRIRIFDTTTLSTIAVARSEDGSGKLIANLATCNINWSSSSCSHLLAAIQKRGRHGWDVVFFESNGLQHGSFKLRAVEGDRVECIDWNSESDLLAVILVNANNRTIGEIYRVQLYHRSNYHWYLKREVIYDSTILPGNIEFDPVKKMCLIASLYHRDSDTFECREYEFSWDFSLSQTGTVAVIDGSYLNITHLNQAVIPPPMCAYHMFIDSALSEVHFIPPYLFEDLPNMGISGLRAVATSCNGCLVFIGTDSIKSEQNNVGETLAVKAIYNPTDDLMMKPFLRSNLRQITVVNIFYVEDKVSILKLLAFTSNSSDAESWIHNDELFELTLQINFVSALNKTDFPATASLIKLHRHSLQGNGLRLTTWIEYTLNDKDTESSRSQSLKGTALIELSDGSLLEYTSDSSEKGLLMPICEPELMFLEPCPTVSGVKTPEGKRLIIGLSKRSRLYMGERLLHDSVSSYSLSPIHMLLAYSTFGSRPQLRFISFHSLFDFDPLSALEDASFDVYESRNLERGSLLVTTLSDRPEAVFILPRGNLELICPRGLLIPFVTRLLQQHEYGQAFAIIRKQKIDVNLLCDVDPILFLIQGGIEKFIEQVQSVDHLNLFIAGLSNTNVTATKYPILEWFFPKRNFNETTFDFSTKINQICAKMRSVMITAHESGMLNARKVSTGELLLPILSTYAKEEPPQLDSALSLIKDTYLHPNHDQKTHLKFLIDKAQGAIQYLAFLSNYELLFDTALGLYDFDLAKAVARNSQLDPKLYLPLLKHYKELPIYKARYEVDLRLKRYESALKHMVLDQADDQQCFAEVQYFIEEHKLHRLALELFSGNKDKQRKVILSLGNRMLQEGNFENALAIFLSLDPIDYPCVLEAARKCRDWQTYFTYNNLMTKPFGIEGSVDVKLKAVMIAKENISNAAFDKRRLAYSDAARILLDYGNDASGAIDYLISGELWFEARRLSIHHGLESMRLKVRDEVQLSAESYIVELDEKKNKFDKAIERLAIVLISRRDSKQNVITNQSGIDGFDETGSLFSMASNYSNVSIRSSMSTSSRSSISSVISAGQTSAFSIIESRSVLDQPKTGKKKNRKPRTKSEKKKLKPGSDDELISLITTLKASITDDLYAIVIEETIKFLSQEGLSKLAAQLFQAYSTLQQCVKDSVETRLLEAKVFENSRHLDPFILPYEAELKELKCASLPSNFSDIFSFLQLL